MTKCWQGSQVTYFGKMDFSLYDFSLYILHKIFHLIFGKKNLFSFHKDNFKNLEAFQTLQFKTRFHKNFSSFVQNKIQILILN